MTALPKRLFCSLSDRPTFDIPDVTGCPPMRQPVIGTEEFARADAPPRPVGMEKGRTRGCGQFDREENADGPLKPPTPQGSQGMVNGA